MATNDSEDVGKWNTYSQWVGLTTGHISVEISQDAETDLPHSPAISILGMFPKDSLSYYRDTCSAIFISSFSQ